MSLLKVIDLTQAYAEKPLYAGASFDVYKNEHIGVVGQNGTGKSTLLQILIGAIVPDEGNVRWQNDIKIGHLDQYAQLPPTISILHYLHSAFSALYEQETQMLALYEQGAQTESAQALTRAAALQDALVMKGFYDIDSTISRVANGLGLTALGMDSTIGTLSGGQRAKVILAKLLLETPDVLLLDEPTNFLDKEHVTWLADTLSAFAGAFVVVSHDKEFLQSISTGILDIEFGEIRKYHGDYQAFLKQKTHLREDYVRRYQAQRKEIQTTEAYIRKNIAGVNSKNAKGRRKQLERVDRMAPPSFTEKPIFHFQNLALISSRALDVSALAVGYDAPLLPPLSLRIAYGERVAITGFNGIGKSTFLKTLAKTIPALGGDFAFAPGTKVGYFEQDLSWENAARTPLQIVQDAFPRMSQRDVRRALARCGVREQHVSRGISTLSGGEQSKVKLCLMLQRSYSFLLLDEPTNHLDAETKEALTTALNAYEGTVLLVSHEESFYRDWADRVLPIASVSS